ncbi:latent-transforming growth factor beta-binding protein 2-like [Phycodurus eques]|uniref:latent-transforming growth factor beta-binding protein 2-like n=1 Tax=Phycodurus eques TaxID=693459 RepID=UPI002ACDBA17|nr:latent-transforming growth factor beta-binding protein 2-like [Phycodurus eques]
MPLLTLVRLLSSVVVFFSVAADGQSAGAAAGLRADGVRVMFTPTICKVRCDQRRCVNHCERGNVTTLFSGPAAGRRDGDRFRVG